MSVCLNVCDFLENNILMTVCVFVETKKLQDIWEVALHWLRSGQNLPYM